MSVQDIQQIPGTFPNPPMTSVTGNVTVALAPTGSGISFDTGPQAVTYDASIGAYTLTSKGSVKLPAINQRKRPRQTDKPATKPCNAVRFKTFFISTPKFCCRSDCQASQTSRPTAEAPAAGGQVAGCSWLCVGKANRIRK